MIRWPAILSAFVAVAFAQSDWPTFGNDPGAMRYSTLRQIDSANVARLAPAWTFHTDKPGSEAIPVVIKGVMYLTAPDGVTMRRRRMPAGQRRARRGRLLDNA